MKQTLLKLTTLTALTLALTACGGGGGGSDTPTTGTNTGGTTGGGTNTTGTGGGTQGTSATFLATCNALNNDKGFASATTVTNKTLHKLIADTRVYVWDLSDGTKKACTETGSVELL